MANFTGSPPHTRERLTSFYKLLQVNGITPAYAGKTIKTLIFRLGSLDHPRIRGKDTKYSSQNNSFPGSPPHTRERLLIALVLTVGARITPAYAGKTR